VKLSDAYGNGITRAAADASASSVAVDVEPTQNSRTCATQGTYDATTSTYAIVVHPSASVLGPYVFTLTVAGTALAPSTAEIVTDVTSGSHTVSNFVDATQVVVGQTTSFSLQSFDTYGNQRILPAAGTFAVVCSGCSSTVVYDSTGQYLVALTSTTAGQVTFQMKYAGVLISSATNTLTFVPDAVLASNCTASGSGLDSGIVALDLGKVISVNLVDQYGNSLISSLAAGRLVVSYVATPTNHELYGSLTQYSGNFTSDVGTPGVASFTSSLTNGYTYVGSYSVAISPAVLFPFKCRTAPLMRQKCCWSTRPPRRSQVRTQHSTWMLATSTTTSCRPISSA
jgi:hypothetical protein